MIFVLNEVDCFNSFFNVQRILNFFHGGKGVGQNNVVIFLLKYI